MSTLYIAVRTALKEAGRRGLPVRVVTREMGISARDFYATVSQHPDLNGVWAGLKYASARPRTKGLGNPLRCEAPRCEAGMSPLDAHYCAEHRRLVREFWTGLASDLREGRIA